MRRSDLEDFLGKYVEVTLFDDFCYRGVLRKTKENIDRYGFPNYYFFEGMNGNIIFRVSQIKKVKKL